MTDQVANFIEGTVSIGYDESAITIVLNSGHDFPDPSGDNYNVVWYDSTNFPNPALDPKVEIDRVTALSTNTITITRAQEGTLATTKNTSGATYKMILTPTAKTITDLQADTTAVGAGLTTHMSDTSTHGVAEIANVATVSAEIDSDITTHAGLGDAHHTESHTVASHSDTTATGAELETLTDGSDADSLHAHAVNDAKVTNATHTGDVTGATALTIGADKVNDTHIDWGTGVNQVSAVDVPIADAGVIITATEIEGALQENRTAIDLNTAKNTNVSTDLSEGTSTETTVDVNSSDGNNATLVAASTSRAGLLTKVKFDEIVTNNSKVTNATHTGEVTGSGALTIANDAVTYAKIQNVVENDVVLGRISGADGVVEELEKTDILSMINVEDGADHTDSTNIAGAINDSADKATPDNDDSLGLVDGTVLKELTWANVKATLKTYFDTLYNLYSHPNHTGEVTSTGDGATVIASDAVTYDKMQDTSATDKLLGRSTIGAGTIEEIACTVAGRAILDDADVATQRTTLDVDQAGTDNSTDVTLAGTPDYITISGQIITRNNIDLTTDVTGALPYNNGGTGQTTFAQGDIIYASAADTLAKLAKGTALEVLAMNSGATAPEWVDTSATGRPTATATVAKSEPADYITTNYGSDDACIQAANDYVSGLGSGLVLCKEGTYSIESPVILSANVHLSGVGIGTILYLANGTNDNVIENENPATSDSYISISNLKIDGNKSNNTSGSGINISRGYFCEYNNLLITNCKSHGMIFLKSLDSMFDNIKIYDCDGDGIQFGSLSQVNNLDNIFIDNAGSHGIYLNGPTGNFNFNNFIIENCTEDGISVSTTSNINISNGICNNNTGGTTPDGIEYYTVDGGNISNVTCSNNGYQGFSLSGASSNINISNSDFFGNQQNGIGGNHDNCTISNCTCYNNGQSGAGHAGISVTNGTYNVHSGCRCYDNQGTKTQSYGVALGGTSNNNTVIGCNLNGNLTSAFGVMGTNNLIVNNPGYNPFGAVGPPSVPATTVNYTNAYGYPCIVVVSGGIVTDIDLDDVSTGLTTGSFTIPPGGTINITYSSVPTWKWWGL